MLSALILTGTLTNRHDGALLIAPSSVGLEFSDQPMRSLRPPTTILGVS